MIHCIHFQRTCPLRPLPPPSLNGHTSKKKREGGREGGRQKKLQTKRKTYSACPAKSFLFTQFFCIVTPGLSTGNDFFLFVSPQWAERRGGVKAYVTCPRKNRAFFTPLLSGQGRGLPLREGSTPPHHLLKMHIFFSKKSKKKCLECSEVNKLVQSVRNRYKLKQTGSFHTH